MLVAPLIGVFLPRSRAVTALDLGECALSLVYVSAATDVARGLYKLCSLPRAIGLTVKVALIIWATSRNWS